MFLNSFDESAQAYLGGAVLRSFSESVAKPAPKLDDLKLETAAVCAKRGKFEAGAVLLSVVLSGSETVSKDKVELSLSMQGGPFIYQHPVIQKPISTNPGLNVYPMFLFPT